MQVDVIREHQKNFSGLGSQQWVCEGQIHRLTAGLDAQRAAIQLAEVDRGLVDRTGEGFYPLVDLYGNIGDQGSQEIETHDFSSIRRSLQREILAGIQQAGGLHDGHAEVDILDGQPNGCVQEIIDNAITVGVFKIGAHTHKGVHPGSSESHHIDFFDIPIADCHHLARAFLKGHRAAQVHKVGNANQGVGNVQAEALLAVMVDINRVCTRGGGHGKPSGSVAIGGEAALEINYGVAQPQRPTRTGVDRYRQTGCS